MSQDALKRKFPAAVPQTTVQLAPGVKPTATTPLPNPSVSKPQPDDDRTDPHLSVVPSLLPTQSSETTPAGRSTVLSSKMPDLGILESFMKDPDVTEVMVNDIRNIMIEKEGKIQQSRFNFRSLDDLQRLISRMLQGTGKIFNIDNPFLDFMLPDGSRVNVVGAPITTAPCMTIRKFPVKRLQIQDLIQLGMLDQAMAVFLNACVLGRRNIVIAGGAGGGKTTLLNNLGAFIPKGERIITIEDTLELAIGHPNSVSMQSKSAVLVPPQPPIAARELLANALRMRPDRILVGECRRAEAFDMLQAMNTGHAGSMTTIHANSPRDVIARLETLCMMSGLEMPLMAIRRQIASAIDIIVHVQRFRTGKRRVTAITEVTGVESETVTLQDIFLFDQDPKSTSQEAGRFRPTGLVPTFVDKMKDLGVEVPRSIFGA